MKGNFLLLVFIVALVGMGGVAGATDYYMSPGGNDTNPGTSIAQSWATIGKCASTLHAGDTCWVVEGTYYNQSAVVANNGNPGNPITFRAYNGMPRFIANTDPYISTTWMVLSDKSYINVVGPFYIEGGHCISPATCQYEAGTGYVTAVSISGVDAHDNVVSGLFVNKTWGVGLHNTGGAHHNIIENNVVNDVGWNSIMLFGRSAPVHDYIIRNNVVSNFYKHNGIDLHTNIENVIIENNTILNTSQIGIFIHSTINAISLNNNITIRNNFIDMAPMSGARGIYLIDTTNSNITGNTIKNVCSSNIDCTGILLLGWFEDGYGVPFGIITDVYVGNNYIETTGVGFSTYVQNASRVIKDIFLNNNTIINATVYGIRVGNGNIIVKNTNIDAPAYNVVATENTTLEYAGGLVFSVGSSKIMHFPNGTTRVTGVSGNVALRNMSLIPSSLYANITSDGTNMNIASDISSLSSPKSWGVIAYSGNPATQATFAISTGSPNQNFRLYRNGILYADPIKATSSGWINYVYSGGFSTQNLTFQEYNLRIDSNPLSDPTTRYGDVQAFSININHNANASWYFDNTPIKAENGVTSSSYTNSNAGLGVHNVSVYVTDGIESVSRTWMWKVYSDTINVCNAPLDVPYITYKLADNINSAGTCLTIGTDNITIDGQRYTINYSQSQTGYGINNSLGFDSITIKNLNIVQGSTISGSAAIYASGMANSQISNVTINSYGTGISLNGGSQNAVSGNMITTTVGYGISVVSSSNIIIDNNITTLATDAHAAYVGSGATSNTFLNNNINANGNALGIYLQSTALNNAFMNNNIHSAQNYGIRLGSAANNIFVGGSITGSADYFITSWGANNFTNTNFTASRKVYFPDSAAWFNYNNETNGNIWLKTSVFAAGKINRTLIKWTNQTMRWNDTFANSTGSITANYNISGLFANGNYTVYNRSTLAVATELYNLTADSIGKLNFAIRLGTASHEIIVNATSFSAGTTTTTTATITTTTRITTSSTVSTTQITTTTSSTTSTSTTTTSSTKSTTSTTTASTTSTSATTTSTTAASTSTTTSVTSTSVTSSTTTLPLCQVKGDLPPCDGLVDDWELLDYINKWAKGLVLDFDLLSAIRVWALGYT